MSKKKDVHYRYDIPAEITVEIDTREKIPVKFPSHIRIVHPERPLERLIVTVKTRKARLECGDYRLAEYPDCCVIERKGSQRELHKNIFNPRDAVRQAKSFRKLSQKEYPFLLIETTPEQMLNNTPYVPDAEALLNRLNLVIVRYGFHVLWMPWRKYKNTYKRRQLGAFMAHLMLACAVYKTMDIMQEVK